MNAATNRDYLQQRILTSSPAQLHLMLIEGAIRFAERAGQLFEANDAEAAAEPLLRAMDITSELLAGVRHSRDEVNVKLASLYEFIFTRLTMAYVNTDREKLAEAQRVLAYERDTWRMALEQAQANDEAAEAPIAKPDAPRGPHKPAPLSTVDLTTEGGLSIEA